MYATTLSRGRSGCGGFSRRQTRSCRRELGDRRAIWSALFDLGLAAYEEGEYVTARECLHEALTIARELRSKRRSSAMLVFLGAVARAQGDYSQARGLLEESLGLAREA